MWFHFSLELVNIFQYTNDNCFPTFCLNQAFYLKPKGFHLWKNKDQLIGVIKTFFGKKEDQQTAMEIALSEIHRKQIEEDEKRKEKIIEKKAIRK